MGGAEGAWVSRRAACQAAWVADSGARSVGLLSASRIRSEVALLGVRSDGAPNFRPPFTSATGWGTFAQQRGTGSQTETLSVRYGSLRLATLALDLPAGTLASQYLVLEGR